MKRTVMAAFTILCLLSTLLVGINISVKASLELHVHNIGTGLDYATIQEAINANETLGGHTIHVDSGIYFENIVVNKSIALVGESKENTTVNGNRSSTAVRVTASDVSIIEFTIQNASEGVYLDNSNNSKVSRNTFTNTTYCGLDLWKGTNNTISENLAVSNLRYGIRLYDSRNNTLRDNRMIDNKYNFCPTGSSTTDAHVNDIDTSNTVNDKPIYYLVNNHDLAINPSTFPDAGYLALVKCTNITVENMTLTHNRQGIILDFTNNSIIKNLNVHDNELGISQWIAANNTIAENNVSNNSQAGIQDYYSVNCTLSANIIECNSFLGMSVYDCENCTFSGNNVTDNRYGISLSSSSNSTWSGNLMDDNGYNFGVSGNLPNHFLHTVDVSNLVDGKPIYYWVNQSAAAVPPNAGYVALVNCTQIAAQNLNLSNNQQGILMVHTTNSTITQNNVTNNLYCISLYNSSDNRIFHNNFINNASQVYISRSGYSNSWDDGSTGNFWSTYTGRDNNFDGIGDTSLVIDGNNTDHYPLMHPLGSIRNLDTNLTYLTIQSAINAPETLSGHTIFLRNGTYLENAVVNKTISLIGENREGTVVDGGNYGHSILVTANNVTIKGLKVTNSSSPDAGIFLRAVEGSIISENDVSGNNGHGIFAMWGTDNTISRNIVSHNAHAGLYFNASSNNSVSGNNITDNSARPKNMTDNGFGIWLDSSSNNTLRNNILTKNDYGFGLYGENLTAYTNDVDASNTIDGKPIYYLVNEHDRTVPNDAGYVALVNCANITGERSESYRKRPRYGDRLFNGLCDSREQPYRQ